MFFEKYLVFKSLEHQILFKEHFFFNIFSIKTVAIKKLYRPFYCLEHGKRTLREFRLLKHFEFENMISLLDSFSPDSSMDQFKELYFVTQYMESDLGKVIKNCQLEESQINIGNYDQLLEITLPVSKRRS